MFPWLFSDASLKKTYIPVWNSHSPESMAKLKQVLWAPAPGLGARKFVQTISALVHEPLLLLNSAHYYK